VLSFLTCVNLLTLQVNALIRQLCQLVNNFSVIKNRSLNMLGGDLRFPGAFLVLAIYRSTNSYVNLCIKGKFLLKNNAHNVI